MMTRRHALKHTVLLAAAAAVTPSLPPWPARAADAASGGPFTLPPLPYAFDALEPHIDAQTMQIHHDKHHQGYVNNLNKAVADYPALAQKSVEELLRELRTVPQKIRTLVRNHGGGHANHSLFWQCLTKTGGGSPKGELAKAIEQRWGSFDGFKQEFTTAAGSLFGSGWAWLSLDGKGVLIEQTSNQDSPLSQRRIPLLGIDVWEHAYYLKYQNRRSEYITAFYNVINWDFVSDRYAKLAR